ncbi:hypothetical protein [Streptomyces sp. NBC_01477]|nr:hypothetical protein [Streptomyces sp. NBC_01477]
MLDHAPFFPVTSRTSEDSADLPILSDNMRQEVGGACGAAEAAR